MQPQTLSQFTDSFFLSRINDKLLRQQGALILETCYQMITVTLSNDNGNQWKNATIENYVQYSQPNTEAR